jgi:hypothetical protein
MMRRALLSLLLLLAPVGLLAPSASVSHAAETAAPRPLRYAHLADGRLIWHYAEGWAIVRSYRRTEKDRRAELFLYEVSHNGQLVATVPTRIEAARVVAGRGR